MAFGLISSSKNAMDEINIDKALFVLTTIGSYINERKNNANAMAYFVKTKTKTETKRAI